MTHRTAASPKENIEEGIEHDASMSSSKKMQGERGGGAALKENVCQVQDLRPLISSLYAYLLVEALFIDSIVVSEKLLLDDSNGVTLSL